MTEKRDPRVDPRPGDEVLHAPCEVWRVGSLGLNSVCFSVRVGEQWLNSTSRITLEQWADHCRNAEVIHVADKANGLRVVPLKTNELLADESVTTG